MDTAPKTKFFTTEHVDQKWFLVDASGKTVGRIASKIAHIIRGKHKPTFTPHADLGDFVVVINAEKVLVTGKRQELKEYYHNTLYPGGARFESIKDVMKTKPEMVLEHAVKGMMPKSRLARGQMKRLRIFAGAEHDMAAQQPVVVNC